jgi:hypothetical protein
MTDDFAAGRLKVELDPVSLVDPDGDLDKKRTLNVVSVDTSGYATGDDMFIYVKYGGAYSGVYDLIVTIVDENTGE